MYIAALLSRKSPPTLLLREWFREGGKARNPAWPS
jgi:hypothetical protein